MPSPARKPRINAAIYARVSTKSEQQQSSIPSQLHMCEERAAQLGYHVREQWIHSDDETGRNMDRPGWQAVMRLMEARVIQAVVVKDRSRVSRNQRDYWLLKEEYLQQFGVQVVPISGIQVDPDNIWTEFAEEDEIREAERFSRILSDKTRRGRLARLAQGYFCNGSPYGTQAGAERGVPVRDPQQWPVVERVYELAASGRSVGEIRAWLSEQGIPTRRGGSWNYSSVWDMLANPFYRGVYVDKSGREWALRHDCVVNEHHWWAAQHIAPAKRGRPRGTGNSYRHLLPRVVCSHFQVLRPQRLSGQALELRPKWSYGRDRVAHAHYYRCDRERASGGVVSESHCPPGFELRSAVNARALDELVLAGLLELFADDERLLVDLRRALDHDGAELAAQLRQLERRLAEGGRELARLDAAIVRLATGDGGDLLSAMRPLNARRVELEAQVAGLRAQAEALAGRLAGDPTELVSERVHALREVVQHGTPDDIAELLALLIREVDLREDSVTVALRLYSQNTQSAPHSGSLVYTLDIDTAFIRSSRRRV